MLSIFSNIKLLGIIGLVLLIGAAVGYHFIEMRALNNQLAIERQNNTTLSTNNGKLEAANQSLNVALQAQQEQSKQIIAELQVLQAAENTAQQTLQHTNDFLTSQSTQKKIATLRSTPEGSTRLLDLVNSNSKCTWQHIYEVGKCVNGQWRPAVASH